MDVNEIFDKLEYCMTKQLIALRQVDERIHDQLDRMQPFQSAISNQLIKLEELLDGMSSILQRDTDLLKRLVRLRNAVQSATFLADNLCDSSNSSSASSGDCLVDDRQLVDDVGALVDVKCLENDYSQCYFSRRNSVLRTPIPPTRGKAAVLRRISQYSMKPIANLDGHPNVGDHECQSSLDSGIHLCQLEEKVSLAASQ